MDTGAWWARVHRVTKSQTRLTKPSTQSSHYPSDGTKTGPAGNSIKCLGIQAALPTLTGSLK